jgi:GH25 family lysozyme M1 (1,4-beta-N-acetylmuramidase)
MDQRQLLTRYAPTQQEAGLPARPASGAATQILGALRRGRWDTAVRLAMSTGVTHADQLTDTLFYLLHPEMRGKRIEPGQRDLAREWIQIRDRYVRPVLQGSGPPATGGPAQPGGVRTYFGIDTASVAGNKNPDWMRAKAEVPVDFAIIRSNWGTAPDSVFRRDWPKLKDAGIVRGAYLFLRFPHSKWGRPPSPAAQARAFIATVGNLGQSDLPPSLDVEFPGGRRETGMTSRQILAGVRDAWQTLRGHYGVVPLIYTSARVWKEDLDNLPAPDLTESPLWLARYHFLKGPAVYGPRVFAGGPINPPVPPPWGDATNWWIHQYQGDAVGLPGFPTGDVDMNTFNVMVRGATGDRVRWAQRRLGIAQSGVFDPATEGALRAFQSKKGLGTDGMVDPRTFAYLCWSSPAL